MPNAEGEIKGGQVHRVYDADGKAVTLTARQNGGGVDGPLYVVRTPIEYNPLQPCYVVVTDQNIRCTYRRIGNSPSCLRVPSAKLCYNIQFLISLSTASPNAYTFVQRSKVTLFKRFSISCR